MRALRLVAAAFVLAAGAFSSSSASRGVRAMSRTAARGQPANRASRLFPVKDDERAPKPVADACRGR